MVSSPARRRGSCRRRAARALALGAGVAALAFALFAHATAGGAVTAEVGGGVVDPQPTVQPSPSRVPNVLPGATKPTADVSI